MCRLYMANKKFLQDKGKDWTLKFFDQLEKSCGGQGNGIILIDEGKITFDTKGVKLTNQLIADIVFENNKGLPDWLLYHTRVASKGSVKDSNCHPYINDEESLAIMMNGTISSLGAFGKYMGDITDTEVAFKLLNTFNIDLEVLTELDPRFIGFKNGKVFATNSNTYSGLVFKEENEGICIASESPTGEVWKKMKKQSIWYEGEELKEEKVAYRSYEDYGYYGYGGYSSLNGVKGTWIGSRFYPYENKTDEYKDKDKYKNKNKNNKTNKKPKKIEPIVTEDDDITIQEALEIIQILIDENPTISYSQLQIQIDELFGIAPILDNMYCDISVLSSGQIMIQDEFGAVYY